MAKAGGAIPINFDDESVLDRLKELTGGRAPRSASTRSAWKRTATRSLDSMVDRAKQTVMLETDRPHVLREMIYVCRPAGTLSIPGSTAA
jgi:threonine dehydrogenase-like Zn-dependent dehydrogenase